MLQESLGEKVFSVPSDKNIPPFWPAEKTKYQSLYFFLSQLETEGNSTLKRTLREDVSTKPDTALFKERTSRNAGIKSGIYLRQLPKYATMLQCLHSLTIYISCCINEKSSPGKQQAAATVTLHATEHSKRSEGMHVTHKNKPRVWIIAKPFIGLSSMPVCLAMVIYTHNPFSLHSLLHPLHKAQIFLEDQQRSAALVA